MATGQKIDRKLVEGLEQSFASVLGKNEAKALLKLAGIPEDKFDPKAINSSLSKIFGASAKGLSLIQTNVVKGMASTLDLGDVEEPSSSANGFVTSLEAIAKRYGVKEKAGFGIAGLAAGLISSICCLGPLALAFLGIGSISASLTLATALTSAYKPIELAASVGFLAITIISQLRRRGQCSLSGLRRNLSYIIIPSSVLLVTYALVNYWVGVTFLGGPGSLLP